MEELEELYKNKDWLYNQYWNLKKTPTEMGKMCNRTGGTIHYWMKKNDLPTREISKKKSLLPIRLLKQMKRFPEYELEVIALFSQISKDLNIEIIRIRGDFPDCLAIRENKFIKIEFEYKSYNFKLHRHNLEECDVIICWEHNWKDCPIEVIELKNMRYK